MNTKFSDGITIDECSEMFSDIYFDKDRKRSYSEIWLSTVYHASNVGEAIRERNYVNACHNLAEVFCWMSGFLRKCNSEDNNNSSFKITESLSELVWLKYPAECPLCEKNHCQCPIYKTYINKLTPEKKEALYDKIEKKGAEEIEYKNNVRELDRLVSVFSNIYGNSYVLMSIEEIGFHFLEEVGEVTEMINKLSILDKIDSANMTKTQKEDREMYLRQLKRELADVFSWSTALIIKLNILIDEISSVIREYSKIETGDDGNVMISNIEPIKFSDILGKFYKEQQK